MPKYLIAVSYTAEGAKGRLKEAATKRKEIVEEAIKSVGGTLESFYYAFGEPDVYVIAAFPDHASAIAHSVVVNASGTTRLKMTPLVTVEEADQIAKKNPQYKPPGQ